MANIGKPAIIRPKDGDRSYRILSLTKAGQRLFEAARKRFQKVWKWPREVSDADTLELVLREHAEMRKDLSQLQKGE